MKPSRFICNQISPLLSDLKIKNLIKITMVTEGRSEEEHENALV